ncbi:hypothetical protein D8I24_6241 [Cupriavidus necator H850]|nr:hypothetical protein D8I24_6241 [Cupriavidus necator H850]
MPLHVFLTAFAAISRSLSYPVRCSALSLLRAVNGAQR